MAHITITQRSRRLGCSHSCLLPQGARAGPIGAIRARSSHSSSKRGGDNSEAAADNDNDSSSNRSRSKMHRLPDPDVRRMPIAGPNGVVEPSGPCGPARRHAPAFFALLAVGLVAATVVTRHGQGGGSGSGGGGGGVGLPHLTGAGGAAGVRLSGGGGAPLGEGASRRIHPHIPGCSEPKPSINIHPPTHNADAYDCLQGVDYEDFGSSFPGLSRRDCAAMCGAMPNCRVWSYDPTREGGLCTTRYDNYTSFYAPEVESCVQVWLPS